MCRLVFLVLVLWCASSGCKRKTEADEVTSGGEGERGVAVPESVPAPERAPAASAREIRVTSYYKITESFSDNPQRAKKEFAEVRWRLNVRVDQINETRTIIGVISSGNVGAATISMRSNKEVEKLSRNKPTIIEAVVADYQPGKFYPAHFSDGIFIETPSPPEPPTPLAGARALTAAGLNEMIEAFDRGNAWAAPRYREIQWSFSGTVVRVAHPGSSYIIDVPNIGAIEASFSGGEKQPKVGSTVDLEGRASRLTVDTGGKPLMDFSPTKLKK